MAKIQVVAADRKFHVFRGEGVRYERDGTCYDIIQYIEEDGETRRREVASFVNPISVKNVEERSEHQTEQQDEPAPHFSDDVAGLTVREDNDRFTTGDMAAPKGPFVTEPVVIVEKTPKHKSLLEETANKYLDQVQKRMTAAQKRTMDAAAGLVLTEKGIRALGEPVQEEPAPKIADLLASGKIQRGRNGMIAGREVMDAEIIEDLTDGISGVMAESVMEEPTREVDIEATLKDAEQRHSSRQSGQCGTCRGRGTIPDPDGDDPLDTIICPDC